MLKEEIRASLERNRKDREWFIDYWAQYVRTHTDEEWSRQQNILINSVLQSANQDINLWREMHKDELPKPKKK